MYIKTVYIYQPLYCSNDNIVVKTILHVHVTGEGDYNVFLYHCMGYSVM